MNKYMKDVNNILIIKLGSIGDIIHTLPAVASIRKIYPKAHISWIIDERLSELIDGYLYIDEVILFPRAEFKRYLRLLQFRKLFQILKQIKFQLKKVQYDLSIDFQGMAISSLLVLLAGARKKIGNPEMSELGFLISKPVARYNPHQHAVDRYFEVAKFLGAKSSEKEFFIQREDKPTPTLEDVTLIGFGIGSRIKQKLWPVENYISLARKLLQLNEKIKIVLFGDKNDVCIATQIMNAIKENENIINTTGKLTLKQLRDFISQCSIFVGNDSGPLHIASAMGKHVIGLYGQSNPELTGPYGKNSMVIYKKLPCSPCGTKPKCKKNYCMELIKTEEVYNAVVNFLKTKGS